MLSHQQQEIEKAQKKASQLITDSKKSLQNSFLNIQKQLQKEALLLAKTLSLKLTK